MASSLPAISDIPALSVAERSRILDLLFEPSTNLRRLSLALLHEQKFNSYVDLIAAVGAQMTALLNSSTDSDVAWLDSILGSHPRLGAKKVDSAQSAAEQAQLQSAGDEAERLAKFNEEYERTFPGLRYVVFVNGRDRDVIMQDMQHRIKTGTLNGERATAIKAMCEIAVDRAGKLTRT